MTTSTPPMTKHRAAMRELDFLIRSHRALIHICSHEERRIMETIELVCRRDPTNVWCLYTWDLAAGLACSTPGVNMTDVKKKQSAIQVLNSFLEMPVDQQFGYQVLVLKDFDKLFGDERRRGGVELELIRLLRNLTHTNINVNKCVIIVSPSLNLPTELSKLCGIIDWPLPEREHILLKINSLLKHARERKDLAAQFRTDYTEAELDGLARAFQGLTLDEVEQLCYYMMLTQPSLEAAKIAQKKRDVIRKSGVVDWIEIDLDMTSVGGLSELKRWLVRRKDAFTQEAVDYGLPANPKGLLLIGVQGGGKSLSAKAVARFWEMPLLRLDMGKVFQGIVGSSEENIRHALKVAESVAPAVLWADEIDKGLSGTGSSNMSDGGTTSRVFGTLLTWMQEKTSPVFLVATANDVSNLPPELLRKGRFDEIFFVDLPTPEERVEIFKIHLAAVAKRNSKLGVENLDLSELVKATQDFTGAEMEAAIIAALYETFFDGRRKVTTSDVLEAVNETVPIAHTMKERIAGIREWADTRARSASHPKSGIRRNKSTETAFRPAPSLTEDDEEL